MLAEKDRWRRSAATPRGWTTVEQQRRRAVRLSRQARLQMCATDDHASNSVAAPVSSTMAPSSSMIMRDARTEGELVRHQTMGEPPSVLSDWRSSRSVGRRVVQISVGSSAKRILGVLQTPAQSPPAAVHRPRAGSENDARGAQSDAVDQIPRALGGARRPAQLQRNCSFSRAVSVG